MCVCPSRLFVLRFSFKILRLLSLILFRPIPVAARSKAWISGLSVAGIAGSNPAGTCFSLLSVVCCQLEGSALG
jgi:hypothetical protein